MTAKTTCTLTWMDFFLNSHNKTHQIAAAWQWWELRCETEIIPALWGRQRWGERSPTRHRTGTKCHQRSHISVLNIFIVSITKKSILINVKSILPLSCPSNYGGHIYLLALWKEKSHRSQSCDLPGQSASAKHGINPLAVEALMMLNKLKRAESITRLSPFQAGGERQRRRSCWCSSSPSSQSVSHPSWNTPVVDKFTQHWQVH